MPPKKFIVRNPGKPIIISTKAQPKLGNNKFLPSWTAYGGAYGKKHFIRKNRKTGNLQYLHSDGSTAEKGNWVDINSKGIKLEDTKEHRGFTLGKDKTFRHYVIDKEPQSLAKKNAPFKEKRSEKKKNDPSKENVMKGKKDDDRGRRARELYLDLLNNGSKKMRSFLDAVETATQFTRQNREVGRRRMIFAMGNLLKEVPNPTPKQVRRYYNGFFDEEDWFRIGSDFKDIRTEKQKKKYLTP